MPADVRVKFSKVGRLQFISHLDLMRTMKTALFRAKVPLKYSEGFNPHPKISFAMQLSVGAQSVCEYMDLKLTAEVDHDALRDALRANLTDELYVREVYTPENKPSAIAFAEYRIEYDCSDESVPDFAALITDPLYVMKRTKSGDAKQTDIRPRILRWNQEGRVLDIVLAADSASYINPEYVAKLPGIEDYTIMRTHVYLADGETEFR